MANAKRRCRYCKEYKPAGTMLLVPVGAFCNAGHALQWAHDNGERAKRAKARAERAEHKQRKDAFYAKDTTHQLKLTQIAVNKLCSLLDAGDPCISCGRPDEGGRKRNASHYKSRGANSGLRFDLLNLHGACQQCNQHLSGNIGGYQDGLWARYGQWILDYLESAPRLKAWTADELHRIRAMANAEIKYIKKHGVPSKDWRALPPAAERAA